MDIWKKQLQQDLNFNSKLQIILSLAHLVINLQGLLHT